MNFHSMSRKELQAECKKHNIRANLTNLEMANRLSSLLLHVEKEKPITNKRTCLKSPIETVDENDSGVATRQSKKVRLSPNNELIEYRQLRSGRKEKTKITRAKSWTRHVSENVNITQSINEVAGHSVRLTRSRAQTSAEGAVVIPLLSPPIEKKRARRVAKDDGGVQSNEEIMVSPVRVTRSRAQTSEGGVIHALNPQVKKKRARGVAKDVEVVEPSKEIVDSPVRVTRSRVQASKEGIVIAAPNPPVEKKRARRETKVADRSVKPTAPVLEETRELPKRRTLRNREVEDDKNGGETKRLRSQKERIAKGIDDVSENENVSVDVGIAQPDKSLRRSRRNGVKVEDSTVLNGNASKTETVTKGRITRSRTEMAAKSSEGNSETKTETGVEVHQDSHVIHKRQGRSASQRKSVMPGKSGNVVKARGVPGVVPSLEEPANHLPRKQNEQNYVLRKIDETGTKKHVIEKRIILKENEMVETPNTPLRRSQRQTSTPQSTAHTVDNKEIPKAVGRKKPAEKSSNPFMMKEGSQDKEHVRRSGRNASRNEALAITDGTHATSAAGNCRPRKRRGDPTLEEQVFEIVCSSPDQESPRRFTRSSNKSYKKELANLSQNVVRKKPKQSKTPMSAEETPSIEEQPSVAKSKTDLVSGSSSEVIKGNSSKKRAKSGRSPRGIKKDGSEKVRFENSDGENAKDQLLVYSEEASASKFVSLQTGGRENENEIYVSNQKGDPVSEEWAMVVDDPTVKESSRRLTRSACKSERKTTVNLPEKVGGKKKQRRQSETPKLELGILLSGERSASAIKGPPGEDSQFTMPEVAEVTTDPDMGSSEVIKVNSAKDHSGGVHCETSILKEARSLLLVNLEEISASKSERLQADVGEKETEFSMNEESSRQTIETEFTPSEESSRQTTLSAAKSERNSADNQPEKFIGEEQQNEERSPYLEHEIPLGVDLSAIKGTPSRDAGLSMTESANDPVADSCEVSSDNSLRKSKKSSEISHATKRDALEEAHVHTLRLSEAKSQVAVKSVETTSKSVRLETDESVMEIEASTKSMRLQIDEREKETGISFEEIVVITGNVGISLGEDIKKSLQNFIAEDDASFHSPEITGDFDARNLADQESVKGRNVADGAVLDETTSIADDYALIKQSGLMTKVEVMECEQEPSTGKYTLQSPAASERDVAEVTVNVQKENHDAEDTENIVNAADPYDSSSGSAIQGMDFDASLITSSLRIEESTIVDCGVSVPEVIESAQNALLSSCREPPEHDDGKRMVSTLITQQRSVHVCPEHSNSKEVGDSVVMNSENALAIKLSNLQSEPEDKPMGLDLALESANINEDSISKNLQSDRSDEKMELDLALASPNSNVDSVSANLQCKPVDKSMKLDLTSPSPHRDEGSISENLQNGPADKPMEIDLVLGSPSCNKHSISHNSDYLRTEEHVNRSSNDSITGTISQPDGSLPVYKSDAIEGVEETMGVADSAKLLPSKHGVLGVGDAADATPENVTIFGKFDQKLVESAEFDEGGQSNECENSSHMSK